MKFCIASHLILFRYEYAKLGSRSTEKRGPSLEMIRAFLNDLGSHARTRDHRWHLVAELCFELAVFEAVLDLSQEPSRVSAINDAVIV